MKRDTWRLTDWAWLAAGLFGALFFFWHTLLPATRTHTYAFSAYYTAARLTLQGQAGTRFCGEWFFEQQRALGFGNRADFFCPNPPTTALILLPVAWLPPRAALAAWVACTLALLAGIIAVGWRIVARPELLDLYSAQDPSPADTGERGQQTIVRAHPRSIGGGTSSPRLSAACIWP